MKMKIMSVLIALYWITPVMGLTIRNNTAKNTRLDLASADQRKKFNTSTTAPGKSAKIKIPAHLMELHAQVGSVIPARKEMIPIEPYKDAHGWMFVGKDSGKNDIYVRLLPATQKETLPEDAKSSYALINGSITRIDAYPEKLNEVDAHRQTFSTASYAPNAIDPNSYLFVTEEEAEKPHLSMHLYDPKVVRKAAALMRYKKTS